MGICDYQCFIHSEGSQCLDTHSDCSGKHKYVDHDSDSEQSHDDSGIGSSKAVLILFDISSKITDPKIALQLLKDGKAKNIRVRHDIPYNWDLIDFEDGDPDSINMSMGYYDSENHKSDNYNPKIPWRVNNEHRDVPYKKLFWVVSMCPTCYKLLTTRDNDRNWCSLYMTELRSRHNISSNKKSDICEYIRKKYKWLRRLIKHASSYNT